jgi:glycosyltransferase involved in cell wall biosynthesis
MLYHIVDHSYAQLVHVLPGARTGVYCHDLDAFRAHLEPRTTHNSLLRPLAWTLLKGVQSAAVVFHSTHAVGDALERHGIVPREKLVHAPYGVSADFAWRPDPADGADEILASLGGRPFILHVGSSVPRKRLDVLFETFARLRVLHPGLRLVQQGAKLSKAQAEHVARLGIGEAVLQPPKVSRKILAGLYRRAAAVLVTSSAEGFGFPVIEALACGAPVVASDIPALREVGGAAAVYAPVGDAQAFASITTSILAGHLRVPTVEQRSARAAGFSWEQHARTILDAYRGLAQGAERRVRFGQETSPAPVREGWASFDAKRKVV